jgi:hypothetical protein
MIIDSDEGKCGLFFENEIKLFDLKFREISNYNPEQQLLYVSKIVKDQLYSFYIDLEGNEYYEE